MRMKALRNFLIVLGSIVALSFVTGYDYIWSGMQETYFRGWKNSNIDDMGYRALRTIEAPAQAQPWPERRSKRLQPFQCFPCSVFHLRASSRSAPFSPTR